MKKGKAHKLYTHIRYLLTGTVIVLFIGTFLAGCQKKSSSDVSILLENIESDGTQTSAAAASSDESDSYDGAVIPRFVSGDAEIQGELEKLNAETNDLRERYLDETADGKQFWIRTYVSRNKSVLQCTVCWFEEHPILGNDYNMMTLAYNTKTGDALTSREALNSMNLTGVELSTNVGRAFRNTGIDGQLEETDMQGFVTDDDGNVTEVYMKLTILTDDNTDNEGDDEDEESEQHFFIYRVDDGSLQPVTEEGYDMP